jgi:hypothetical protein
MKSKILFSYLLFLLAFSATAKTIIINVGDLKYNDETWMRQTCKDVYEAAKNISFSGIDIICSKQDTSRSFVNHDIRKYTSQSDYIIHILRTRQQEVNVDIVNLRPSGEEDLHRSQIIVKKSKDNNIKQEDALKRALTNFLFYVENEEAVKFGLFFQAIKFSNTISYNEKTGEFLDKAFQARVSPKMAYKSFVKESERKRNYLRAGVEIGVLLSAGMAVYYKNLVYNEQDFDYGFTDGLKEKFITGDALLYDDNDKWANYGHAFAGVLYHQVARTSGFNSLESLLIGMASSAAWEIMEYHELFSINDQVITPVGGYVIGEALLQASCALISKNGIAPKIIGHTLSSPLGGNQILNNSQGKDKWDGFPDCKKPAFSEISIKLGVEEGQKPYDAKSSVNHHIGFDSTVINIPEYAQVGKKQKLYYDAVKTKINIEHNGSNGLQDLRIVAEVVAAAYYQKNIQRDGKYVKGYEFSLGLASATTWNDRGSEDPINDRPDTKEDFYGTINVLGASAFANLYYKGSVIRAEFAFYGDFTMVKSYALEQLKDSEGLEGQSSIIKKRGYYWGTGHSVLGGISIEKGRWKVGYQAQRSSTSIINGRERNAAEVTRHDDFNDSIKIDRFYVQFKVTKSISIELAKENIKREGRINKDYSKDSSEDRFITTIRYLF